MGDWQYGYDNGLWGIDGSINFSHELEAIKRQNRLDDLLMFAKKVPNGEPGIYDFWDFKEAVEYAKFKGNLVIQRSPDNNEMFRVYYSSTFGKQDV
ncbi:hypothetical protein ACOBWM_003510 [Vibrio cholerae]